MFTGPCDVWRKPIWFSSWGLVMRDVNDRLKWYSNSHKHADLATYILKILGDKWVLNTYTLIHANTNAWIHFRCFIDIVDIDTLIPTEYPHSTTYYKVGRLAFDLLPILLPRIQGPAVSQVHDILLGLPIFHLIENDPLRLEKVKAAQAIQEFWLQVWF